MSNFTKNAINKIVFERVRVYIDPGEDIKRHSKEAQYYAKYNRPMNRITDALGATKRIYFK